MIDLEGWKNDVAKDIMKLGTLFPFHVPELPKGVIEYNDVREAQQIIEDQYELAPLHMGKPPEKELQSMELVSMK